MKSLKFFKPTLATTLAIVLAWLLSVLPAHAGYTVTLQQVGPPYSYGNDNFINRWILTGATGSIGFTIYGATKEPGEPLHAGNVGGHSIWYSWTAPASGVATFHISRSVPGVHFYPLLAVYTGNTVTSLSVIASSNGSSQDASVMFSASAGVAYEIAIDGKDGTTDYADVGLRTPPLFWQLGPIPTPTPMPTPTITISSSPAVVNEGGSAAFTISTSTVNPSQPLTVNYVMGGKTINGVDYTLSEIFGQVTIPAGASSATVTLNALTDNLKEKREKAIMTLRQGVGYNLSRKKQSATVTIANVQPTATPAPSP